MKQLLKSSSMKLQIYYIDAHLNLYPRNEYKRDQQVLKFKVCEA